MNTPYTNPYTNVGEAYKLLLGQGSLRHPTVSRSPSGNESVALATLAAVNDPRWYSDPLGIFLTPVVGMGVTLCYPNDSYPYEIVRVVSGRTIDVRSMKSELHPDCLGKMGPGKGDAQKWIITSDPLGKIVRLRLNQNMVWKNNSITYTLGVASRHNCYDI